MDKILVGLNPEQKQAVQHKAGPLLILAGAGSGKTRVLTHHLAYLIKKGVDPNNILAVTFTNKAANEMKERVQKLVAGSGNRTPYFLGTFHSMAVKILKRELDQTNFPWDTDFVIYDQDDSLRLIKAIIKERGLGDSSVSPIQVRQVISSLKQDRVKPEQAPDDNFLHQIVKPVYYRYQKRLASDNALDFDDLLEIFIQLLEKYPTIREKYQNRFEHILVDEYQDTNLIQYQMIKILAQPQQNLVVVGDDWQSIYAFRGADFRNILRFKKDYPKAKIVKLEQNYRSTKNILSAAQNLIENNRNRSKKKLWTDNDQGDQVQVIGVGSGEAEAQQIISQIEDVNDYSSSVILYRTHAQSRLLEERLIYNQIPYQIVGGVLFYQRKEIKDLISYLWLAQLDNPIHLSRAVNIPPRGIGAKRQEKLAQANWDLKKMSDPTFAPFKKIVKELRQAKKTKKVSELIDWLVDRINYREYLKKISETDIQFEARWENIQELINVGMKYQKNKPEESLELFLTEVSLMDVQDEMDDQRDKITLMTLHNVKGLEFNNVWIVGLEEGIFPHQRSLESNQELEEERRLCYVGMTRAKKKLHISWAQNRAVYGQLRTQQPSRFISEIQLEVEQIADQPEEDVNQVKRIKGLAKGQKIKHLQLGVGVITTIDDDLIEIEFPKIGRKKFSLEYAPLEKID